MDRKSRREIARKIAKLENIIKNSSNEKEKNKAMRKKLNFKNFSDIITLQE